MTTSNMQIANMLYVNMQGNLEATRELLCAPGIDIEARDEQVFVLVFKEMNRCRTN